MAATKAVSSVMASTPNSGTGSAVDISAAYGVDVYISLDQASATTSSPATVQIQVSPDGGTTYYSPSSLFWTAGTAIAVYYAIMAIPATTTHLKATFVQAGAGVSTVVVQAGKVTGV